MTTDAVVHCRSQRQAESVKQQIVERFAACGRELHSDKTQTVHCKDSNRRGDYPTVQFTFLGFTFMPRKAHPAPLEAHLRRKPFALRFLSRYCVNRLNAITGSFSRLL